MVRGTQRGVVELSLFAAAGLTRTIIAAARRAA